jgi:MYXO-CTERM domain-containing protein
MKIAVPAVLLCSALASTTQASFVGWTSTVRLVAGGSLINVFAVVDNSGDVLLSVYGSNAQSPNAGYVTTTSAGGFIQGSGLGQGLWKATTNQSWTTLDSFLTVGGSYNTTTGVFLGNSATNGDPSWNVSYFNTASGETAIANAFGTENGDGFTNPYTSTIPALAGFFLDGGNSSPARSLAGLAGIRYTSSNATAAAGSFGMMIGQFYVAGVAGNNWTFDLKLGATVRRASGSVSQDTFTLTVPAPGAVALLAVAGLTAGRRRRA